MKEFTKMNMVRFVGGFDYMINICAALVCWLDYKFNIRTT